VSSWLDPLLAALDEVDAPVEIFFQLADAGWSDDRLFALLDLAASQRVPVDVAVIPRELTPALAAALLSRAAESPGQIGLHQHGFDHRNRGTHAQPAELHPAMPRAAQLRAIQLGKRRLLGMLGLACDPIFTPPWGRCTRETGECLRELGFAAVSPYGPFVPLGIPGLVDLPGKVKWFDRGPGASLGLTGLGQRLADAVRTTEPVGVVMHHELMDRAEMAAAEALFRLVTTHPRTSPRRMWSIVESLQAGEGTRGRMFLVTQGDVDATGPRRLGGGDVLLSAAGREQSRAVCALLSQEAIDALYTSSLPRAVETVIPVALERSLELIHDDDLRERGAGEGDGDVSGHLLHDPDLDESLSAVHERAVRFLNRVAPELAAGRTIVAVGNRAITQMLLLVLGAEHQAMESGAVAEVTCVAGAGVPRAVSVRLLARTVAETQ
jgi:broad specificity phosphatase PhoE